jgi:hypothetical protein
MVVALLAGAKSQTRRLAVNRRGRPTLWHKFKTGDRLWVRETIATGPADRVIYRTNFRDRGGRAFYVDSHGTELVRWHVSIHMPRAASRLTLTVTDIRRQFVQDIDDGDAAAEGAAFGAGALPPREDFRRIWKDLHGVRGWCDNRGVIPFTFSVDARNIVWMHGTSSMDASNI